MTDLTKAHTLLVIPSDPLRGMLDEGPCGFRPPMIEVYESRCECSTYRWAGPMRRCPVCHIGSAVGLGRALVLRWQGEWLTHGWVTAGMACGWPPSVCMPQRRYLMSLEARGCTIIGLDEQGKEVTNG